MFHYIPVVRSSVIFAEIELDLERKYKYQLHTQAEVQPPAKMRLASVFIHLMQEDT